MAELREWATTAASNNSAPPDGFPENMQYSEVNNAAREVMAVLARHERDTRGTLATGGTANAITITPEGTYAAYYAGLQIGFTAGLANTGAVTVDVGAVGAVNLVNSDGTALASGDIAVGGLYFMVYDGTQFRLRGGGGAADTGAVSFGSGFVDLTDSVANLVSGSGTSQHIEMDSIAIQGKISETAVSGLGINPLGGFTSIGHSLFVNATSVSLFDNQLLSLRTDPTGVMIYDGVGDDPMLSLYQDDAATRGGYLQSNATSGHLELVNELIADNIQLRATATGDTLVSVLVGDPDGDTTLYAAGNARVAAVADGLSVLGGANVSPSAGGAGQIVIAGNAYVGSVALDATAMYVGHNSAARALVLRTNNTDRLSISGAGVTTILNAGSEVFRTASGGVVVTGNGSDTSLDLHDSSDVRQAVLSSNDSDGLVTLRATVNSASLQLSATNSGGTSQAQVVMDPDVGVTLNAQGAHGAQTQVATADYTTTGLSVRDHNGDDYDVGFNVMPPLEIDVTTQLSEIHVGKLIHRDGTANCTFTLPSGLSGAVPPVGSMIMLSNENATGTMSISAMGTLHWFNGDGTPSTGTRTLAHGGICTVYHYGNSEWQIWGIGLS